MTLLEKIKKGKLDHVFAELYGKSADLPAQRKRYARITRPDTKWLFSTSGRTELAGNHTDHNHGFVLAASINLDTIAAVSPANDNTVTIASEGYDPVSISIDDLEVHPEEAGRTEALVRGIARNFSDRGFKIGGFTAYTTSSVLKGSGLSSSAAIEVLTATIFNHLFAQDSLSTTELAIIGQYAENVFFGKPCGLMDQIACANGGIVSIDFADPTKPKVRTVNFDFSDVTHGHTLVVVDTGGNHADLTDEYAAIPFDMKKVASLLGHRTLNQVGQSELMKNLPLLRTELKDDRALLRAIHFINETRRAKLMYSLLKKDDFTTYLQMVGESGSSSFEFLQNVYCSKDTTEQGLSLALALSSSFLKDSGAYRVHGGGFAGTIQVYVPTSILHNYIAFMEKLFGKGSCTVLTIRQKPTMCIAED